MAQAQLNNFDHARFGQPRDQVANSAG